jgi:sugar phosphate isomerase/epimerase
MENNNSNKIASIHRRDFIKQSTILTSSAILAPSIFNTDMKKKFKMGLQLYTMRSDMAKDPAGSLKRISAIGYEDLETYGYDPEQNKYYGYNAAEFKKVLEDNNLTTSSGHYDLFLYLNKPIHDLKKYVDQCITGAHALNQKYITWPWLDPQSRTIDKFKLLAERLNIIGEQIKKANLGLAYHNHDYEFIDQNGQIGYDIVMKETDPALVKLQIDLFWAAHSSQRSPHELFKLQPGRFVMWHIKDMDKEKKYTELGNGTIDFPAIMPDIDLAGMEYYFVEQGDYFKTSPFQSITDSAAYVKKNLKKWLE